MYMIVSGMNCAGLRPMSACGVKYLAASLCDERTTKAAVTGSARYLGAILWQALKESRPC